MIKTILAYLAGAAMVVSVSSEAMAADCYNANIVGDLKVQQLDILLMVNSLRCRTTADDFQADYDTFQINHRAAMGRRINGVIEQFARGTTPAKARAELEAARTVMANRAAQPAAITCGQFKQLVAQLAPASEDNLAYAADFLVTGSLAVAACPVQVAVAALPAERK
jgi:hypothetical protein